MESKLNALLKELTDLRSEDPTAKTLVFSSFSPSLSFLGKRLKERGFEYATITGSMSLSQRAKALEAFQRAPPTTIFLLSLRSGAVGLNLTAACHVVLLEPCWNPALEEQAIGRVHRLGQTKATVVKRLIVRDSVEERIIATVRSRVAGGGAAVDGTPCDGDYNKMAEQLRKFEATRVPTLAGGMRSDKAALRFEELKALFNDT